MKKYVVSEITAEFEYPFKKNIYTQDMADSDFNLYDWSDAEEQIFTELSEAKKAFKAAKKGASVSFNHSDKIVTVDAVELEEREEDENGDIICCNTLDKFYAHTKHKIANIYELY